jgi:ubiquinone/menaquinone biosynthesis C-methylase UbiE
MFKWIKRGLIFSTGAVVGSQIRIRLLLRFHPVATPRLLMPLMDTRLRRIYRDTGETLDFVGIHSNATVLDAGCGTGLFAIEAARRVGSGGTVFAVDFQPALIDKVTRKARAAQLHNLQPTLAPIHELPLPGNCIDAAFMISVLAMLRSRKEALREIKRVLKPGGVLVLGEELPEPEYVRPVTACRWAEEAGFRLVERNGNAFAYLLRFVKPIDAKQISDKPVDWVSA